MCETAIFFAGPGDTQLVNRVGATVAAELAGGPRSVDFLAEAVIAQSGWDDLLTLKLALTSLLGQWQKAGLVEPDDR